MRVSDHPKAARVIDRAGMWMACHHMEWLAEWMWRSCGLFGDDKDGAL